MIRKILCVCFAALLLGAAVPQTVRAEPVYAVTLNRETFDAYRQSGNYSDITLTLTGAAPAALAYQNRTSGETRTVSFYTGTTQVLYAAAEIEAALSAGSLTTGENVFTSLPASDPASNDLSLTIYDSTPSGIVIGPDQLTVQKGESGILSYEILRSEAADPLVDGRQLLGSEEIIWTISGATASSVSGGVVTVGNGETAASFTVRAELLVDGGYPPGSDAPVISEVTVNVTEAAPATYTILSSAGENGTISPNGSTVIGKGGSQSYTIVPDEGFMIDTVTIDGVAVAGTDNVYTFSNVSADADIRVTFKAAAAGADTVMYTVSADAGEHGSILPSGSRAVPAGTDVSFTLTPNEGYVIDRVEVDGQAVDIEGDVHTLKDIQADTAIFVTFKEEETAAVTYTITAGAGAHGKIFPAGEMKVTAGERVRFTFTPDAGYVIDVLTVDGREVTPDGDGYTLSNVQRDTVILVTFKAAAVSVTPGVTSEGTGTADTRGNTSSGQTDTGDETPTALYGLAATLSLAGLIAAVRAILRRKQQKPS